MTETFEHLFGGWKLARARLIESAIIVLACIATFAVMWVKSGSQV